MKKNTLKNLYIGDNKIRLLDQRYLPRWIVVVIDVLILMVSFLGVVALLRSTPIQFHGVLTVFEQGAFIIIINTLFFFVFKTYSGIIRHSTFTDIVKLVFSAFATFASLLVVNIGYEVLKDEKIFLTTLLILYMLVSFSLMLLFRMAVKEVYQYVKKTASNQSKRDVIIVGLNDQTISIGNAIANDSKIPFNLKGFVTSNPRGKRLKLHGKPIIPIKKSFKETLESLDIEGVLLISDSFSKKVKNEIVEDCLLLNLKVYNVPNMEEWNSLEDITTQISPIQIEDLLEREVIKIDTDIIEKDLTGKTILVTGGAGSIGSEIVKQIAHFSPALLVVLDQAESALHTLELELIQNYPNLTFITELADISNMYRLELLFEKHKFNTVYHAAAYKHVPLIERNPHEAVYVNILGTVNLSVLSVANNIEKFVMVSTDKAVNPTNVMGASKRAAEMYVQSLQNESGIKTRFITTRFGNVLGSNGSVIPYFRKQIEEGGPVTVTHKEIIRYFMTIPEACQLVLQAGTMGKGGEIFVFDMGEPVKILDLAEKMIRLSGLEPYDDIAIQFTGLRPGEKLFEELLNDSSKTLPTHHSKIMITKVPAEDFSDIKRKVKTIIKTATRQNNEEVVKLLKDLVPEFKSQNSSYSSLDS